MRFSFVVSLALVAAAAFAAYSWTPGAASTADPYDVNNSGAVTIADAIYCLNYVGATTSALPCNVNADTAVSIADVLAIVSRIGPVTATATSPSAAASTATGSPTAT